MFVLPNMEDLTVRIMDSGLEDKFPGSWKRTRLLNFMDIKEKTLHVNSSFYAAWAIRFVHLSS